MDINFGNRDNLFILGAGASKDYGLPVWKELSAFIKDKLENDRENKYSRTKDILAWLAKVGRDVGYKTIDECIAKESISESYYSDGDVVENELFSSIKDIFNEAYLSNNNGWITKLSDIILRQIEKKLEDSIAFVSYNYDNVLEKNFLKFDYLPGKHMHLNSKPRLNQLSYVHVPVLYAHGNLYFNSEIPNDSHTKRHYRTMKSGNGGYIDVVSCYESDNHEISYDHYSENLKLYILGLGSGLEYNLSKLKLAKKVSQVSVTISDSKNDKKIVKFLSDNFSVPIDEISVYRTCIELIDKCF